MPAPEIPPPLPSLPNPEDSPSTMVAWIVMIASVIFLAWTANEPLPVEEAENTAEEVDNANELAILKLQSRVVIGVTQFNKVEGLRNLEQLKLMATTPQSSTAVAIVNAFADQENGLTRGLEILDELDELTPRQIDMIRQVRNGLEKGITPEERTLLEPSLGWFSKLIKPRAGTNLDFAKPIRAESMRSLMIMGGFVTIALLAFLTGVVLLIRYFVNRSSGKTRSKFCPDEAPHLKHLFIESFAIYIGLMALGHLLGTYIHAGISMIAYAVSFLLAVFWPKIRGCSWKQYCQLVGWHRGTGFFREVGAGILGYFGIVVIAAIELTVMMILMYFVNLIQHGGAPPGGAGATHPIVGILDNTDNFLGKFLLLFLAAGLAPFLEETMFRGTLFRYFRHKWGFLLSAVIGGIVFAIIHPQGLLAVPALGAMGIGFALLREWRDSLIASMTAHAINNGAIVCLLLLVMG